MDVTAWLEDVVFPLAGQVKAYCRCRGVAVKSAAWDDGWTYAIEAAWESAAQFALMTRPHLVNRLAYLVRRHCRQTEWLMRTEQERLFGMPRRRRADGQLAAAFEVVLAEWSPEQRRRWWAFVACLEAGEGQPDREVRALVADGRRRLISMHVLRPVRGRPYRSHAAA